MEFIIDESVKQLGVEQIVVAKVYHVDPNADLSPDFELDVERAVRHAESVDIEMLREQPIIHAYREKVKEIGRSLKKYPPSAETMIKNVARSGRLPRINSIVDVYNVEAIQSYLSIGAHDLDQITFPIEFTQSKKEDVFTPILSTEKKVGPHDYIYRDQKGVMAYLDARDSDFYKITDQTKDVLFIIQGNQATDVVYRLESLKRILKRLEDTNPNMKYEIDIIK
ncbi:B3/B4 domain-containing protein [Atopobacter phocae]|uniref:B3/B4 domain-containing protein n=1 Tax=Atopobacter phocae TaxID=136492 RepID=UPI0004B24F92|nr:phenylalanine--tRNA ligase beta subunit-related protein [Atopobacter phocae]